MDNEDIRPVRINGIPVPKIERVSPSALNERQENAPSHEKAAAVDVPSSQETRGEPYEDIGERGSIPLDAEPAKLTDREVMEHTAAIWQYKPIADNGVELHTECHAKHCETDFAEVTGARVRGKKHKHDGTNCDDWFETAEVEGCIIAVVSDGAGSKSLSRIGARLCCEGAVEYLKTALAKLFADFPQLKSALSAEMSGTEFMAACGRLAPLVQDAARHAFDDVINYLKSVYKDENVCAALGRNPVLSDFSSTFLAAVIIPLEIDGARQSLAVTAQIGDGCICAVNSKADADGCLKLLGEPDSGAFSGETEFLSERTVNDNSIAAKTRISRGSSDVFMLMSDGVADDYFPAAPMIKRLYLDLCLNGILPMEGECTVAEQPEPIRFRSVSMSQRSVELQYAKQLMPDGGAQTVDMLWDKRGALKCHSLEAYGISLGATVQERLLTWLDNYNERGSFDDRTLVIIKIKE
ncbi:MAG: PP2C family serine/threonine-protein phosphatase [Oscillospiraceae bacterium]